MIIHPVAMHSARHLPAQGTRAFSLAELSVVLVVIGLLAGGILAGRAVIRASEIRSYVTDTQRYQAAITAFNGKYNAMPGDMKEATNYWGILAGSGSDATCANTVATGLPTCNGDGDGYVQTSASSGVAYDERFRFWQHLTNAGVIEGHFTGRTDSGVSGSFVTTPGLNEPKLKGDATFTAVAYGYGASVATMFQFTNTPSGNFLEFKAIGSGTGAQPLTPGEAWSIDAKIDDGIPATGFILGPQSSWTTSGSTCTTSDVPATAIYNLSVTDKVCRFNVRL